jgi:hypothetical protein
MPPAGETRASLPENPRHYTGRLRTKAERHLCTAQGVGGKLRATFPRRRAGSHNLVYSVQASTDRVDWTTVNATEMVGIQRGAEFDNVIFEASAPANVTRVFLRLRAPLP